jgi:iron-sulfur cluster assembly protein
MNLNIEVTPSAEAYIQKMLEKEQGVGFRLTIKKTGCSGYSYVPAIVEKAQAGDASFTTTNGITIYIDPMWQHMLSDLQIDYAEDDKAGLKQKRLVFSNKNESGRCGCGESFHVSQ